MHGLQCSLPHFHSLVRKLFVHILTNICIYFYRKSTYLWGTLQYIKKTFITCARFGLFDKSFETHHDNYLPAGWVLTLSFTMFTMFTRTKWDTNFMSTLWEHFGNNSKTCSMRGNSEACSMGNMNEGNYKVLRSYWGILLLSLLFYYYYYHYYYCWSFCNPALRSDVSVNDFGISLHWPFCICAGQIVLVCFYVYLHILAFCCVPHPF